MIVYLYVHLPSEMAYVGSTETTLEKRFEAHWGRCKDRRSPVSDAMLASERKSDWLRVTLEEYDDLESMLRGEVDWMLELETVRPRIGFNSQVPSERDIQARLNRADAPENEQKNRPWSAEELERFREAGRAGAAKANAMLTKEQRSEAGKLGAAAVKARDPADKARFAAEAKAKWQSWWDGLTPEQREEQRENGRKGGLKGGVGRK